MSLPSSLDWFSEDRRAMERSWPMYNSHNHAQVSQYSIKCDQATPHTIRPLHCGGIGIQVSILCLACHRGKGYLHMAFIGGSLALLFRGGSVPNL